MEIELIDVIKIIGAILTAFFMMGILDEMSK